MAGTITKRGDNAWLVRIFVGRDENGKVKHLNKVIHGSKKDAEKYRNKVLRDRDLGTYVATTTMSVSEYLTKWLEEIAKNRVKESTFKSYVRIVQTYIVPQIGMKRLSELQPYQVQFLYNGLIDRGLSPRTVRYTHSVITSALRQAVRWRLISVNPCEHCDLPQKTRAEMRCFTPAEAKRFLEAAKGSKHYAVFLIAIETGLRPGEYLGLQWKDLDLDNRTLAVRRSVKFREGGGFYFTEPKTSKSRRSIPLSANAVAVLREHRHRQLEYKMKNRDFFRDNDLVFANEIGDPIRIENLRKRHFEKIVKQAGLEMIRLYDLRHTTATLLLAAGLNPKVVSERLGHSSVVLTLDTYSHVLPTMQQDATEKLEKLMYG